MQCEIYTKASGIGIATITILPQLKLHHYERFFLSLTQSKSISQSLIWKKLKSRHSIKLLSFRSSTSYNHKTKDGRACFLVMMISNVRQIDIQRAERIYCVSDWCDKDHNSSAAWYLKVVFVIATNTVLLHINYEICCFFCSFDNIKSKVTHLSNGKTKCCV